MRPREVQFLFIHSFFLCVPDILQTGNGSPRVVRAGTPFEYEHVDGGGGAAGTDTELDTELDEDKTASGNADDSVASGVRLPRVWRRASDRE